MMINKQRLTLKELIQIPKGEVSNPWLARVIKDDIKSKAKSYNDVKARL